MKAQKTKCGYCGSTGQREEFVWIAHLDFCAGCFGYFQRQGWVGQSAAGEHVPTKSGLAQFPGLQIVSACPRDGMPIYRRWIEAGIAKLDACPYCLGKEDQISKITIQKV